MGEASDVRSRSLSDAPSRTTDSSRETFESIRVRASKATGGADSFRCCCPAHDDHSPSLSVKHDTDRVLLHCWTGCEPEDVCRAFGLELADLFDPDTDGVYAVPAPPRPNLREEARAILAEERSAEATIPPIPCEGLAFALERLRKRDPLGAAQLAGIATGESWERFTRMERAVLTDWAVLRAGRPWRAAVVQKLGTVDRDGHHHAAPPAAVPETPLPATFEEMPDEEHAKAIAHDVWDDRRIAL